MTDRDLMLDGAHNVRDLGGLSTVDVLRVRPGIVLRAASVADLTDADVATLLNWGLSTVVDLRGPAEVACDGRGLLAATSVAY